ncbi:MAG: ribose 5-phosphate isomerase B [Proteobacteria bacterium]|nr:ribose 5-phosphate isomerase B [Pseudomonadota bacterium]
MTSTVNEQQKPRVVIACDHGGLDMKCELVTWLRGAGYEVTDFGVHTPDPVDYPDMAHLVAQAVANDSSALGIVIDGAGIGSAMTANKVPGVLAAPCYDTFTARNSREHNCANVLTLGGRVIGGGLAQEIVRVWLETPFGGGRHQRRVDKMRAVESCYSRADVPCSSER